MVPELTFIVSEPSITSERLCTLLTGDGLLALQTTPGDLMSDWCADDGVPDLLLVNAAVDIAVISLLALRVQVETTRKPVVMTFSDRELSGSEFLLPADPAHIIPPFRPGVVRSHIIAYFSAQIQRGSAEVSRPTSHLRKHQRDLRLVREIQTSFLPDVLPVRAGWQLTARFQPAKEVAGDFYDAFELLGCSGIALIRSLLRHTALHLQIIDGNLVVDSDDTTTDTAPDFALCAEAALSRAVVATNEYLIANHLKQGYFATLFFGVLDPLSGSFAYINCGHNPPILRRFNGDHVLLSPTGPALGLEPGSIFELGRTQFDHGDLLFAYTDGVTEAKDSAGRFFTEERMLELVVTHTATAEDLLNRVEEEIKRHMGTAEQFDDITMIALHRQPG